MSLALLPVAAILLTVQDPSPRLTSDVGQRHALIVCGLTGDAPHRDLFAGAIEKLYQGLTTGHGFSPARITVLWSEPKTDADGPAIVSSADPATRESLAEAAATLEKSLQSQDTLGVF